MKGFEMFTGSQMVFLKKNAIQANVDVFMIKEGDSIVAYCPALELSTYAVNIVDAKQAFSEAIEIFFEDIMQKGTLDSVMTELGWTARRVPNAGFVAPKAVLPVGNTLETVSSQYRVAFPV